MTARTLRRLGLVLAAVAGLVGGLVAADALLPPPLDRLRDLSPAVLDRDGRMLRLFVNRADKWRLPATADAVAPVYRDLLFAYEDRRFLHHVGIDPASVVRAAWQNLRAGHVVSGASTLTMQVARLLEPRPRTLAAKLVEMARAVQLELRYDKETILGMYLTLAPFGGNLEGVRAAALAWFGQPPHVLSVGEAALLVALPRAPSDLRPDRAPARARVARDQVLDRAVAAGMLEAAAAEQAKSEPVPAVRRPMPRAAFHLAERVRTADPSVREIGTTVDGSLQQAVEELGRRVVRSLHPNAGLAILVVETPTRAVAAYLGAPDAFDEARFGPIDMVRAVRSPGSTLKPFIYALGFQERVIHPETLVADVSTSFGGYAPANFDKGFSGEITVREALQRSLNVPAVVVLDRVGPARLAALLTAGGATLVFPPAAPVPSLPMALGGVSVSLWDLATLYTGLANGGTTSPLRVRNDSPPVPPVRFISETAAWDVVRILEGTVPPQGLVQAPEVTARPPVALKTGTSYGFRDAWAFGITRGYTVGVWVGRPDGTPSPDRYGRNTAAPLLYQVFDLLPAGALERAAPPAPAQRKPAPDLLRRLDAGRGPDRPIVLGDAERLRLVFPTPDIVLDLERSGGGFDPLALQASGGRRPLTWLVDGVPIDSPPTRRDTVWQPERAGFARITVIDADGRSAAAEIQVR